MLKTSSLIAGLLLLLVIPLANLNSVLLKMATNILRLLSLMLLFMRSNTIPLFENTITLNFVRKINPLPKPSSLKRLLVSSITYQNIKTTLTIHSKVKSFSIRNLYGSRALQTPKHNCSGINRNLALDWEVMRLPIFISGTVPVFWNIYLSF